VIIFGSGKSPVPIGILRIELFASDLCSKLFLPLYQVGGQESPTLALRNDQDTEEALEPSNCIEIGPTPNMRRAICYLGRAFLNSCAADRAQVAHQHPIDREKHTADITCVIRSSNPVWEIFKPEPMMNHTYIWLLELKPEILRNDARTP